MDAMFVKSIKNASERSLFKNVSTYLRTIPLSFFNVLCNCYNSRWNMNSALYAKGEIAVQKLGGRSWKCTKECKNCRKSCGLCLLEKDRTITGVYYATLPYKLKGAIQTKRPHLVKKKVPFHYDNAPAHMFRVTAAKLHDLSFKVLPHAPYSTDLAPTNYFLFPNLKKWLTGRRFTSNDELKAETNAYFASYCVLKSWTVVRLNVLNCNWIILQKCCFLCRFSNHSGIWNKDIIL